jgi:hypothetical protein
MLLSIVGTLSQVTKKYLATYIISFFCEYLQMHMFCHIPIQIIAIVTLG